MRFSFLALPLVLSAPIGVLAQEPERSTSTLVRVERDRVVVDSGARLDHVVEKLAPVAQRAVLLKGDLARKLEATTVRATQPLTAPSAKAGELLEALLFAHDVVLIPPPAPGLPWDLVDLRGNERHRVRAVATRIGPEEIAAYASRYVPLSVTIPIQFASAREIAASLRHYFTDANVESLSSVGNTNAVLVYGFGPTLATVASMIRQLDDEKIARQDVPASPMADELIRLKARLDAAEKRLAELSPETPEGAPVAKPKK